MAATEPIRDKKIIKALTEYYLNLGELRNYLLIVMGLHTALRVGDLLRLTWGDVYDFGLCTMRSSIMLTESKTKKSKIVALNKDATNALKKYSKSVEFTANTPLFVSRKTGKAIGRVQAYRIVRDASDALELGRISCHSLRKTFGYHAWKSGASPAVIMAIYAHTSFAVTQRYLGIEQDEKNEVYNGLNFNI